MGLFLLLFFLLPLVHGDLIIGQVTRVIDGDTIVLNNDIMRIRLAVVNTPERGEEGFSEATDFMKERCLNKLVIVDPDNNQDLSFGRQVGVVYCDMMNMNKALLDSDLAEVDNRFCDETEFSNNEWLKSSC